MTEVRRIINDISFSRFMREVVEYATKHPDATIEGNADAGDDPRAENAFMFRVVLNYTE